MGQQQWSSAQESLLSLEKSNVASVDDIIRSAKILRTGSCVPKYI